MTKNTGRWGGFLPEPTELPDAAAVRAKYQAERAKRLAADRSHIAKLTGVLAHYLDDPYTPASERAPVEDEVDALLVREPRDDSEQRPPCPAGQERDADGDGDDADGGKADSFRGPLRPASVGHDQMERADGDGQGGENPAHADYWGASRGRITCLDHGHSESLSALRARRTPV